MADTFCSTRQTNYFAAPVPSGNSAGQQTSRQPDYTPHTSQQSAIPLANGFPARNLPLCERAKRITTAEMLAINSLVSTLHLQTPVQRQLPQHSAFDFQHEPQTIRHALMRHHCCCHYNYLRHSHHVGRDSSVAIATRYGLDGPGFEYW